MGGQRSGVTVNRNQSQVCTEQSEGVAALIMSLPNTISVLLLVPEHILDRKTIFIASKDILCQLEIFAFGLYIFKIINSSSCFMHCRSPKIP